MATLLTYEEWKAQKPPMSVTRIDYPSWTETHFELCEKWILEHCEGWVYFKRADKYFIFGLESDATLFDLWEEEGILNREKATIVAKEDQ